MCRWLSVHSTNIGLHHKAAGLRLVWELLLLWCFRLCLLSHEGRHSLNGHLLCWHHSLSIKLGILGLKLIKSIHRGHWLTHLVCKATRHWIKHHWLWSHLIWEELLRELLRLLLLHVRDLLHSLADWLLLLAHIVLSNRYLLSARNWSLGLSLLLLILLTLFAHLTLTRRRLSYAAFDWMCLLVILISNWLYRIFCGYFVVGKLVSLLYLLLRRSHFLGICLGHQSRLRSILNSLWSLQSLHGWLSTGLSLIKVTKLVHIGAS